MMELKDVLKFIEKDDQNIQHEQMLGLLTKIETNTRPPTSTGENDIQIPIDIDLNQIYTDYQVWTDDGKVDANSLTISAVDLNYWYSLDDYAHWVKVDMIDGVMTMGGHRFSTLYIKTEETADDTLRIVISGRKKS